MSVRMYARMYVGMYVCTNVCMHACMHISMWQRKNAQRIQMPHNIMNKHSKMNMSYWKLTSIQITHPSLHFGTPQKLLFCLQEKKHIQIQAFGPTTCCSISSHQAIELCPNNSHLLPVFITGTQWTLYLISYKVVIGSEKILGLHVFWTTLILIRIPDKWNTSCEFNFWRKKKTSHEKQINSKNIWSGNYGKHGGAKQNTKQTNSNTQIFSSQFGNSLWFWVQKRKIETVSTLHFLYRILPLRTFWTFFNGLEFGGYIHWGIFGSPLPIMESAILPCKIGLFCPNSGNFIEPKHPISRGRVSLSSFSVGFFIFQEKNGVQILCLKK